MENKQKLNEQSEAQILRNLIILKNLIPGHHDSQLIERFKQSVLNQEDDEEQKKIRQQLLDETPPKLTFRNKKEEDDFYKDEANNCTSFCCGTQALESNLNTNQVTLSSNDNYMLSIGTGKLYEGTSGEISGEIQRDIHQEGFGTAKQELMIEGIQVFNSTLVQEAQRDSSSVKALASYPAPRL